MNRLNNAHTPMPPVPTAKIQPIDLKPARPVFRAQHWPNAQNPRAMNSHPQPTASSPYDVVRIFPPVICLRQIPIAPCVIINSPGVKARTQRTACPRQCNIRRTKLIRRRPSATGTPRLSVGKGLRLGKFMEGRAGWFCNHPAVCSHQHWLS